MCLNNVDDNELDMVTIFGMHTFSGSDPLPEGWSGERPEYHHHRLFGKKLRKPELSTVDIP